MLLGQAKVRVHALDVLTNEVWVEVLRDYHLMLGRLLLQMLFRDS